jgi:uncharacterized protein YjbI with pentapeptide repeats
MDMNEFWECFDREERDFQGVQITAVYFDAIELDGLDFRNADFTGAQIRKSILRNCNFEGATFEAAHFERASFIGCQLSQANFVKATATELHFDDCDLSVPDKKLEVIDRTRFDGSCEAPRYLVP